MSDQSQITRVLLDTNAFLYFINNDPALGKTASNLLESEIDLLISSASLWEIAIKFSIGKLTLPDSFENFVPFHIQLNGIEILPITMSHLERVSRLPFHHKDPFDRMIIGQSLIEDLPVATSDIVFDSYGILRIW